MNCKKLTDSTATDRIAPMRDEFRQGLEHEAALAKGQMRNNQVVRLIGTSRPQDDIEVEDPRPPPSAWTAAEAAFHALEQRQELVRPKIRLDQSCRIGERTTGGS